jgi:hypothetical protein
MACSLLVFLTPRASGKTTGLSAIEIYPAGDLQAYVQLGGFILDGKNEVRLCNGAQTVNKDTYGKLPKLTLAPGMSLERDKKGVLLLTRASQPECVVPGNLKFEKSEQQTPSELAEKANVVGQVISKSENASASIPPFAPGVKIVLVAAPDSDLAEFLRAQRSNKIAAWQAYLVKSPTGTHVNDAKSSLALLYLQDGQGALDAYRASLKGAEPNYDKLQSAESSLKLAKATAPNAAGSDALAREIGHEIVYLNDKAKNELELYHQAATTHASGYAHLVAAETISQVTLAVDPDSPETFAVSQACKQDRTALESRIQDSNSKLAAGRADEAYRAISPVRSFATEYSKIEHCLTALYLYHVAQGKKDSANNDLQGAIVEFQKASEIQTTPEVADLLKAAQQQAQANADKAAVAAALAKSTQSEADNDYITAFEVLDTLPPTQRATVTDRIELLKDKYVQSATLMAKQLQHTHSPIKGLADENGILRAYYLFGRCDALTNDPTLQDEINVLGENLSAYYLQQAKHYLERPDGTGVNVGWTYLQEALQYKASNTDVVRDEMTRAGSTHQLRSRLSIRVIFRDQTSRREAVDFAVQLTDALATGLESSGLNIKVVRPNETTSVQPNFELIGDVLQNSKSNSFEQNPKTSKYRSGELEVPNEEWNKANRIYESATLELQTAQHALEGAEARGKKKEIADAKQQIAEAEKKVEDDHVKLDALPKTRSEEVERPYTYTERINHLRAVVELQFRVMDSAGNQIIPTVPIPEKKEQDYTILENVKPEDTTGVRAHGEVPDENQFLEEVESEARDRLLKEAKEKVARLPAVILENADRKASEGDLDGAAELYVLYLTSTDSTASLERQKAQKFLLTNYNFRSFGDNSPKS